MILYHGSNVVVEHPIVSKGKPSVDFGQAFYVTSDYEQAKRWANQVKRRRGTGTAYISEYEIDDAAFEKLKVLRFAEPNVEWLRFVAANRRRSYSGEQYDVVVGPVADDGVVYQLNLYSQHLITLERLVKELTYRRLNRQYFFGTERAINKLIRL